MREILFKAKRTDNGMWIEGYYVYRKYYYITKEGVPKYEGEKHFIHNNMYGFVLIDESTLCQYSGLTDKNGNKIWENDVVQIDAYSYTECEGDVCGQVVYSDAYASFGLLLKDRFVTIYDLQGSYTTIYEVLGNSVDNPELLKAGGVNG